MAIRPTCIANELQDAALSFAQVMQVTRRAADGIRFLKPTRGIVFSADLCEVKDARKTLDVWIEHGANPKTRGFAVPGTGLLIEPKWVGERGGTSVSIPVSGNGRGVLKNRMLYATGRKPDVHTMAEIRSIMDEQARKGFPMRDLLKAVVRSRAILVRSCRFSADFLDG